MTTVADVLRDHGFAVDESVLAGEVDRWLLATTPEVGSAELSAEQEAVLAAGSLPRTEPGTARTATARAAAEFTALLASACTTGELATALGVHETWVRQLARQGRLWSVARGRSRLFPRAQFTGDLATRGAARIPLGLADVLAALPADLHPLSVHSALTAVRLELDGRSVVQWLSEGREIQRAVAAVAAADLTS